MLRRLTTTLRVEAPAHGLVRAAVWARGPVAARELALSLRGRLMTRRLLSSKPAGPAPSAPSGAARPSSGAAGGGAARSGAAAGSGAPGAAPKGVLGAQHVPNRGPVSWASLALLVATGLGVLAYVNYERERRRLLASSKVESTGKALLGGPFELVDHEGKPVTDASLRGEYVLLYFGFTFCPDICPNELVKMGQVLQMLDRNPALPKVRPVFISVDPRRDTVAQLAAYLKDFHPRMVGLTGTPAQVSRVAKAYRVYFAEGGHTSDEDDEDYIVDHSIVMYFLDEKGEFIDFFPQLSEPAEIAERITAKLKGDLIARGQSTGDGIIDTIRRRFFA